MSLVISPRWHQEPLPRPCPLEPLAQAELTIFPVLEGRRELFGSDPGDPCFLLGLLSGCECCLSLGLGVQGPGEDRRQRVSIERRLRRDTVQ